MGRPSAFSHELAAEILDRMAGGEALNAICQDDNIPPIRTVRRWVVEDRGGFAALYARAREAQADYWASEIITLADEVRDCTDSATVQAARLRVDARKWIAAKMLPRQYGDRLAVGGDQDNPLKVYHQVAYVIVDPKEPGDAAETCHQDLEPAALRALPH